jgi:hypothetical protein
MSLSRIVLVLLFALGSSLARAQQTATASPPAAATEGAIVLQKALAALSPTTRISDVTLSGTARRIAGSDDESGTVVLKAVAGTGTRLDLTLPSGPRTEIRNTSAATVAGSWSGPDGASHPISDHNLLTDPGWAPVFTIATLLSSPNAVINYVGPETRKGQAVSHIVASQQFPAVSGDTATDALMRHLTKTDVYLDATTELPVAIALNIHPDNNANLDIPVEIRFSDYRPVSGAQIPFHIQQFINNSLVLDLQFDSATLNSGLSATTFTVGAGL